jgi:DNA adenine methylase
MKGPLKTHGGKHYLANRLVAMMPSHTHYVEPYAGGLAVLLHKSPEGISEVVNDLNGRFTNFWKVLKDEELFQHFHRRIQAIPFSESEWLDARDYLGSIKGKLTRKEMVARVCRDGVKSSVHSPVIASGAA